MDIAKTGLLFGPYKTPALKVGDHAQCLYRETEVVIYDWTEAPIPWPLCRYESSGSGRGVLVEEELARAIRHESAAAVVHWWGACRATVRKWRRILGVGRMDAEGSRRLIHIAALGGLNARHKHGRQSVRLWTDEELQWLQILPDEEVAHRTGRTVKAVKEMRRVLGQSETTTS